MEKIVEGFTQEKNSDGDFVPKAIRAALIKKFVTNTQDKKKELKMPINSRKKGRNNYILLHIQFLIFFKIEANSKLA